MIIYRIISSNDSALRKLGEEGWILSCISEGKMYLLNRDRALEIMWNLDSEYDSIGSGFPEGPLKNSYIKSEFNYSRFNKWLKYSEWLITHMYFLNGYTADKVIENLKRKSIF